MFHKIIYSYDSEETDPNFVSFIADDFMDNNKDIDNSVLPDTIPILPLRNTVIFPGSRLPISVGREKSLRLIKSLGKKQRYIGLVCQKDGDIENPEPDDLYRVGVIAEVMRVIELGNDNLSIIIQAKKRFEWDEMVETEPFFKAKYKIKESVPASKDDKEYIAILDSIRDTMIQMLQLLGEPPKELLQTLNDEAFLDMLVSYCATNLPFDSREKPRITEYRRRKRTSLPAADDSESRNADIGIENEYSDENTRRSEPAAKRILPATTAQNNSGRVGRQCSAN